MAVRVKGDGVCESALESVENCIKVFKGVALPALPPSSHQRGNPTLLILDLMNTNNVLNP